MNNIEKLRSSNGLCVSLMDTDIECADKIKEIIGVYLGGYEVERASRTKDDWRLLQGFPVDFGNYRYRIRCEYCGGTGNAETELYDGLVNCPVCTNKDES